MKAAARFAAIGRDLFPKGQVGAVAMSLDNVEEPLSASSTLPDRSERRSLHQQAKGSPALYECEVMHQRLVPQRKPFHYRVFMLRFDLAELPKIAQNNFWLGHNRFNLFSINDADHVTVGAPNGIRENLMRWLADRGREVPDSVSIELVTFPSVLGYGFNPVSFYCVSSESGEDLFIVAEVVNTFREMKLFLVDEQDSDNGWHRKLKKDFYVSPFSDPGDDFQFRIARPDDKLAINIDNWHGGEKTLVSSVRGKAHRLTSARLLWYFFKYPLLSLKIIGGIHWHAFKLWLAKVPFFRKSAKQDSQTDLLRPHSSLKDD
jgi:DUF1365 family protein